MTYTYAPPIDSPSTGLFDFTSLMRRHKPILAEHQHMRPGTYVLLRDDTPVKPAETTNAQYGTVAPTEPTPSIRYYLKPVKEPEVPAKIYGDAKMLVDRFMRSYVDRMKTNQSTGVMLSGLKGSGKTLTGVLLGQEMIKRGGITILINRNYTGDDFVSFLQSITQEALVLFDEFEKVYTYGTQKKILTLFSGVNSAKKLFCLMVNDRNAVEENMNDRPDRLRYNIYFSDMSQKSIGEYLVDHKVVDYDKSLEQFQNLRDAGAVLSFDMVRAIVEEMERFNEDVYTASQFIIAPKVKERDKFKMVVEGGPIEFELDDINYTQEQLMMGPKLSFVFNTPSPDEDGFSPRRANRFSLAPPTDEPKPEAKEEDEEKKEKKRIKKEFITRLKAIDLQPDDCVSSDRVLKRYVFEYEELTITFTADNSNRKNPAKEKNRYYDSY